MQFTQQSAATLNDGQTIKLMGAYPYHLRHGATLQKSMAIVDQTFRGYIRAAANVLTVLTGRRCLAYDPATLHQHQPAFHPFLREQLTQRAHWRKPRNHIDPFTTAMFDVLFLKIQSSTDPSGTFISPLHAIFDWTRLGLLTGSRLDGADGNSSYLVPHDTYADQACGQFYFCRRLDFCHQLDYVPSQDSKCPFLGSIIVDLEFEGSHLLFFRNKEYIHVLDSSVWRERTQCGT
jgi:hypothetical protein